MGLEEVKGEIINKARKEAEAIISEGRKEALEILKNSEEVIKDYRKKAEKEKKKTIEELEKITIASARSEANRIVLDKKKELIKKVFKDVRDKLKKITKNSRKELIKRLVEKAKKEIDISLVYCSREDLELIEGYRAEQLPIMGGIVVENNDKTVRVDYSFESVLSEIEEKNLYDMAKILFK